VSSTVILLGVTSLLTDLSSEMVVAVLPLYLTLQIGLSPLGFGLIDGLYQGATVVARLGAAYLADRTRRPKGVAVVGYGLSAVCKLAYLPAAGLGAISAVVAVDRTGKGIRTAPRDALIAGASAPENLGLSFGVHRALDTVGAMLGPLAAFALLALAPTTGYSAIFMTSFAVALVGLAVLVLLVPEQRRDTAADQKKPERVTPAAVRALLTRRAYAGVIGAAGLLSLLTISDGFLYLTLLRRESVGTEWFPLLYVGTSMVYLLLAVPVGRLADRVGRGRVFLSGYVALLVAYAAAALAPGTAGVAVALALLGVYYAATDGVLSALAVPMLPAELRSTGLAVLQTVVAGGRFVASVGFGLAWTVLGRNPAYAIMAVGLALALPAAATLLRPRPEVIAR
jgi:MFS family permease